MCAENKRRGAGIVVVVGGIVMAGKWCNFYVSVIFMLRAPSLLYDLKDAGISCAIKHAFRFSAHFFPVYYRECVFWNKNILEIKEKSKNIYSNEYF